MTIPLPASLYPPGKLTRAARLMMAEPSNWLEVIAHHPWCENSRTWVSRKAFDKMVNSGVKFTVLREVDVVTK